MKIKNDASNKDFNLQSQQNAWNVPVLPNGANKIGQNDLGYANEDGITPIINAVEIDWNGAVLPNSSTTIGKQTTNRIGEIIWWN